MGKSDFIDVLLAHVAATLPETHAERRRLLEAMKAATPVHHPAYKYVTTLLESIHVNEVLQRHLNLCYEDGSLGSSSQNTGGKHL